MALVYENECCGCAVPAYPCMGDACPNRNVPYWYCDECEDDFKPSELYDYNGMMLCKDCLAKQFKTIEEKES